MKYNTEPIRPDGGKDVAYEDFPDGAIGLLVLIWGQGINGEYRKDVALLDSGVREGRINYTYKSGFKAGKRFQAGYHMGASAWAYPLTSLDALIAYVEAYNAWEQQVAA